MSRDGTASPLPGCVTLGKYITSIILGFSFIEWDDAAYLTGSLGGLNLMTQTSARLPGPE